MKTYVFIIFGLVFFSSSNLYSQCSCGPDSLIKKRLIIPANSGDSLPFNAIAEISVLRIYNFGHSHSGTAALISDQTLLTAGHVLVRNFFINRITISFHTSDGIRNVYLKKKDFSVKLMHKKLPDDIAILVIKDKSKISQYNKFHFELTNITDFGLSHKAFIHVTGYPCDMEDSLLDKSVSYSNLLFNIDNDMVGYNLYTCEGDSGAPLWFIEDGKYFLSGVHHGGNEGFRPFETSDQNVGTLMNSKTIKWITDHE